MANCPNCGHGDVNYVHVCKSCGKKYCSYCNDKNPKGCGNYCPVCGSTQYDDEQA